MGDSITIERSRLSSTVITVEAGKPFTVILTGDYVEYIEVPDMIFNTDSAVPCLDNEAYLVRALYTAKSFAAKYPTKELVVFGHTDTSGKPRHNYTLSGLRAKAVRAILDNDDVVWKEITDTRSIVQDYQTILNTLDSRYGWGCSCGEADNVDGPATKAALKIFQQTAKDKYGLDIKTNGIIGPQTWNAFLVTYVEIIKAQNRQPDDSASMTYGYPQGNGIYGCGESFPIEEKEKDNHRSQLNRRVELIFMQQDRSQALKPPPDQDVLLQPSDCFPYDTTTCRRKPVPLSECGGEYGGEEWIEIQLNDNNDKPIPDEKFIVFANDGTEIQGSLDQYGYAKVEKLFAGDYYVVFPDIDTTYDPTQAQLAVDPA